MHGVVEWFTRSYGFIVGEDSRSYFCHWRDIVVSYSASGYKTLFPGQEVEFAVRETPKGPCATDIIPGPIPPGYEDKPRSFREAVIQK